MRVCTATACRQRPRWLDDYCRQHAVGRTRQSRYVDVLPYQVALGFTLRWFEGRPHIRLYLGPLKFHAP